VDELDISVDDLLAMGNRTGRHLRTFNMAYLASTAAGRSMASASSMDK